jgi:SAM-dependent methyltransferase
VAAFVRSNLNRVARVLRREGLRGLLLAAQRRLIPPKAASGALCASLLRDKHGLEIGGPSAVFARRGILPLYPFVGALDNMNFAAATVWEGRIEEGETFRFDPARPPGRQFIAEATNLSAVPNSGYDFVLSSHTLEHTANPLRALQEWIRVVRCDGLLVLILPHRDGTFDHRRPVTPLSHLVEDLNAGTTEDDLTHLPEILALHDLSRDPLAGDASAFEQRGRTNSTNRCLHHHVFDTRAAVAMADHMRLQILAVEAIWPFHIVVVARKLQPAASPRNAAFLSEDAEYRSASPFPTDRPAQL